MTNFNFLNCKSFYGSGNKDLICDSRFTVGSPSGEYCSKLMRFMSVLAILLTVGVGNVWGATGCTEHYGNNVESIPTTHNKYGPVATYYKYSTRQILYTRTDLNLAAGKKGTIKSIYFNANTAITARKITIYMANSSLATLNTSNYVRYGDFTQVFTSNSWACSTGWNEIVLTTPFEYNGRGNLVVLIDDNSGFYKTSETFNCNTTGVQIWIGDDSNNEAPSSTNWSTYEAINYRPSTKFCIQEADMEPATVTLMDNSKTLTEESLKSGVTLPSRIGCTGYTFAGWTKSWTSAQNTWTTTAPTVIPEGSYTPVEEDENLYPVYTKTGAGTADYSKTETFENQSASSTYSGEHTFTAANSNAGISWYMYCGTVSTNAVLTSSKSAQMRWYSSATSNIPYIETTTTVSGLQKITFNAAVSNANIKMKVEKKSANGSWTTVASNVSMSTSKTPYTYNINGTIGTGYYIRIGVDGTNSTAPSSGNYTFRVDDVKFDYTVSAGTVTSYISTTTCTYNITYHCNDATSNCPDNASGQTALPDPLPTPTKTGFDFGGWFTNAGLTIEATAGETLVENVDLYAKWDETISCAEPTAPGNSSVSGTSASISTESASANYDIYHSTSSTTPTTQDPTATITSGQSQTITGLAYGTTYYYWMRQNCGSATSSWVAGDPESFTTTIPAPTGLSTGSITTTGVTFTITDADDVNNYEIYYSTTNSAPGDSPSGTVTSTSKTKAVTGLTSGTTYYCWVRAIGPNANSSWCSGGSFATKHVYSVTWKVNNGNYSAGGSSTVNEGSHVETLPTAPDPNDYCGDKFVGWTDATNGEYTHGTSNLYKEASEFPEASDDQVFYAVFADYDE